MQASRSLVQTDFTIFMETMCPQKKQEEQIEGSISPTEVGLYPMLYLYNNKLNNILDNGRVLAKTVQELRT